MTTRRGIIPATLVMGLSLISATPAFSQEPKKEPKTEAQDSPKSLAPFQGLWQLDRVEADGRALPKDLFGSATLDLQGLKYELVRKTSKETKVKGTLSIPDAKSPDSQNGKDKASGAELIAVDIVPQSEGGPLESQKAVIALIGDKLHLCSGPPGIARPASLNTNARENVTLMIFSRKK